MTTDANDPELLAESARALAAEGRIVPALEAWNRRIALGDVPAETWCEIGHVLFGVGEFAQALRFYERSIEEAGDSAEAHHHLGQACFKLGDVDRAMTHLRRAVDLADPPASRLALATLVPGAPSAEPEEILAVRRRFAERLAAARPPTDRARPARSPAGAGRIRVGYVSGFFPRANYMKPVWALVNGHDRRRFGVHLFSDTPPEAGMEGYEPGPGDRVHAVGDLDNDALAERVASLGIDVLVDLNGYSVPERLGLYLVPPAPVVVAWFNMYATSGLPGIDYLVGDEEVVSRAEAGDYDETLVQLPVSYLTFTVPHRAPPVVEPPCARDGGFTFGSLVAQYKVNHAVIAAWARILAGAPDARLLLANRALGSAANRAWVETRFAEAGVEANRLELLGPAPHYEYLQHYDRIDLALDAFPYNGGTTTMEAIWQGVPVLTFGGDRWAARTSRTLLARTHLAEFVADDVDGMVAKAIALANDPATTRRLADLRRDMRERLSTAPVCDAAALVRAMERFYLSVTA